MIDTIARLQQIAGLLAEKDSYRAILAGACEDEPAENNGHLRFPIANSGDIVSTYVLPFLEGPLGADVEISLLAYEETMPPHRHEEHDGVMVMKSAFGEEGALNWERLLGNGSWDQIVDGEVLVLPRGAVHGLRPLGGTDSTLVYAISVNSPPSRREDIHYVT